MEIALIICMALAATASLVVIGVTIADAVQWRGLIKKLKEIRVFKNNDDK